MTADIAFLCIAILLVFFGWRSGVLGQLLRVVAAVAVIFCTAPVSLFARQVLFQKNSPMAPAIEIASMVLAAICIYIVVSILGWLIIKTLHKMSDVLSTSDKFGGALIGGIKAALIVYVLASMLLLVFGALEASDAKDKLHLRDGHVTHFVQSHNLISPWRYPDIRKLHAAIRIGSHIKTSARATRLVRDDKDASAFLRRDAFKLLLDDPGLVDAARYDRYANSLFNEKVRAFLKDDELAGALKKVKWDVLEKSLGIGPVAPPSPGDTKQIQTEKSDDKTETKTKVKAK